MTADVVRNARQCHIVCTQK